MTGRNRLKVHVTEFQMARYPVTNAQFQCFVDAGGYDEERYWTEAGWAWRQGESEQFVWVYHGPKRWEYGLFPPEGANLPVVYITWHEALAYTRWLAEVTDKPYRLPTEAEWEKAARGDKDRREYPWGDKFDPEKANLNIGDEKIGGTSPVGIYPGGASPYGIMDLSGNVWEWCSSLYQDYPYEPDDGREDLEAEGIRVLRGGSWVSGVERSARGSSRYVVRPSLFYDDFGFRILVSARSLPF
jgi:formylglycine-generating enzyme required for sulfatase activity